MGSPVRRPLLAVLAVVAAALAVTGCVSMPNAGPVLSYPVTEQTGGQNGQNLQFSAQPPGAGWKPQQIVSGFLIAAAANQDQVAREYLAPGESKRWNPASTTTTYVYKSRPNVLNPVPPPTVPAPGPASAKKGAPPPSATVEVNGTVQAILSTKDGTYAVPSASGPNSSGPQYFTLVKTGGEWRISAAPSVLLLTQTQFANDYDLRNLYFFDPTYHYLVPDPVYVPLQASASRLTTRLVDYLKSPPGDWLAGGRHRDRLPARRQGHRHAGRQPGHGERHRDDQQGPAGPDGVAAAVDAGRLGPGRLPGDLGRADRERQGVYPAGSTGNPVENLSQASYGPATGASATPLASWSTTWTAPGTCTATASAWRAWPARQTRVAKIGPGYSQIAVSQDGKYLAALRSTVTCTSARSTARSCRSRAPATRR